MSLNTSRYLLTLVTVILSMHLVTAQGIFKRRKTKIYINYAFTNLVDGEDKAYCKRTPSSELSKTDAVDRDISERIWLIESFLQRRKSGNYDLADAEFIKLQNQLQAFVLEYNIEPNLSDYYQGEFDFYKKHPVKTPDELQKERIEKYYKDEAIKRDQELAIAEENRKYSRRIQQKRDSVRQITKGLQARSDSIDNLVRIQSEKKMQLQVKSAAAAETQRRKAHLEEEAVKKQHQIVLRKADLITRFGIADASLIIAKKVKIGWDKTRCVESLGKPRSVNRTTMAGAIREQWVIQ